jgi:hypothetical protein
MEEAGSGHEFSHNILTLDALQVCLGPRRLQVVNVHAVQPVYTRDLYAHSMCTRYTEAVCGCDYRCPTRWRRV